MPGGDYRDRPDGDKAGGDLGDRNGLAQYDPCCHSCDDRVARTDDRRDRGVDIAMGPIHRQMVSARTGCRRHL